MARTADDGIGVILTEEEKRAILDSLPPVRRRVPKASVAAAVPVSPRLAAAARANPESVVVRVTARADDGTTVVDRPRRGRC